MIYVTVDYRDHPTGKGTERRMGFTFEGLDGVICKTHRVTLRGVGPDAEYAPDLVERELSYGLYRRYKEAIRDFLYLKRGTFGKAERLMEQRLFKLQWINEESVK